MIDFVQLKKVAQEAQESQVPFTINSMQILELLAIQAQLVAALSHPALYELLGNVEDSMDSSTWSKAVVFMEARDVALAAAGA